MACYDNETSLDARTTKATLSDRTFSSSLHRRRRLVMIEGSGAAPVTKHRRREDVRRRHETSPRRRKNTMIRHHGCGAPVRPALPGMSCAPGANRASNAQTWQVADDPDVRPRPRRAVVARPRHVLDGDHWRRSGRCPHSSMPRSAGFPLAARWSTSGPYATHAAVSPELDVAARPIDPAGAAAPAVASRPLVNHAAAAR